MRLPQEYLVLTKMPFKTKTSKSQNIMDVLICFKMMTRMLLLIIVLKITLPQNNVKSFFCLFPSK